MKCLKIAILVAMMLSTVFESYPQSLLISSEYNYTYSQVEVVDKIYNSANDYLKVDVIIPQVDKLHNKNKQDEINNIIITWTEEWINDAKTIADEYFLNGPAPGIPYELFARYNLNKIHSTLSFYIDYYQFTGGAHGITTRKAYTLDNSTGNLLSIGDLFKEGYNYKRKIDDLIRLEIENNPEIYFTGKEGFNGIDSNTKFYIDNDNLVIYFGQYEIAPYVTGIPEFNIPIKIFGDNFKY